MKVWIPEESCSRDVASFFYCLLISLKKNVVTISLITLLLNGLQLTSDLAVTFFCSPPNLVLLSIYRWKIQRFGLWFNLLDTVISVYLICEIADSMTGDLFCVSAVFVRQEIILKCWNKNVSKFMGFFQVSFNLSIIYAKHKFSLWWNICIYDLCLFSCAAEFEERECLWQETTELSYENKDSWPLINRGDILHCRFLCLFLFYQISPTYLGR